MRRIIFAATILIFSGCVEPGTDTQVRSLTTTIVGGNGNAGIMFTVTAMRDFNLYRISAQQFDATAVPNVNVAIYFCYGELGPTATGWVLAGSAVVDFPANGTLIEIPINLNLHLNTGEVYGIYLTVTDGAALISYTNYSALTDLTVFSNSDISIDPRGVGIGYVADLSGARTPDRSFNGTIRYQLR